MDFTTGASLKNPIYSRLKQTAYKVSEIIGNPSFYIDHDKEIAVSDKSLRTSNLLKECMSYMSKITLDSVHGITHAKAVALDAGAVIQVEGWLHNIDSSLIHELIISVQLAGLLHDIKRMEKNHTVAGSNEAKRILKNFQMEEKYKRYVTAAIRNHEAFKKILEPEDEIAKLLSDSLYDADKFRWGPDNFTTTLWLMLNSTDITLEVLYKYFLGNLKYIESIKTTFRTETGKKYGPEFIDMGIVIGQTIYKEMSEILNL
ncbi:MAG: hypothetical protein A2Y97_01165 [Nitrospirae bacterium RBG_13_39_12]|nr:MAG: hypothetical protein A2Y97_01165 [Nitrospirae bacterium RBG_13_39_12]